MQAALLTDYIKHFDGAISHEHCDAIVAMFEAHRIYDERRTETYSFDQIVCNETPGFTDLAQFVAMTAYGVAETYFGALDLSIRPQVQGFENVRIKRYLPGRDFFNEHVDVADYASARRYLVCMTYLSDNDEGQTTFDGLGVSIECRKGRMAVFPPLWMFPHAGRRPVKVPKYTVCTLLHYL